MGSPGTFGLSKKKAKRILQMVGRSSAEASKVEAEKSMTSARGRRFFEEVVSDREWRGFLSGSEWRTAARLVSGLVASALANARQKQLNEWAADQGLTGDTALIKLGNNMLEELDQDLQERDLMAFELATYALRQTLDKLYAPDISPFDVDRDQLLRRLTTVNVNTALRTYIESYLQELVRHIVGGVQPATDAQERQTREYLSTIEGEHIPQLAREFLDALEGYSSRKYGKGRAMADLLGDIPEWLAEASEDLFKGGSK